MALAPTSLCLFIPLLRERGRSGSLPLSPFLHLRDWLHGMHQSGCPLLFPPVHTHKLPFRQVPLDAVRGSVALSAKLLNEGLGLLDTREAHELAPQFDAPLLPMNTTSPLLGTIDGIAPVELIEQRGDGVLVAGDRVGHVQGQSRALDLFVGVA